MRAHVIDNGKVVNTIEVEDLSFMPNLIDASVGGGVGDTWDGTKIVPKGPEIPMEVSMRQFRRALMDAGLYSQVDAFVKSSADSATQIDWEFAAMVRRDWPTLLPLAIQLGKTEQDVDNIFVAAAQIGA